MVGEAVGCEMIGEAVGWEVGEGDWEWGWDEELGVDSTLGLVKDEAGVEICVGKEEELEV